MSELNFKKIINSLIICAEFADLAAGEGIEINGIDPSDAIMDLIDQLDLSGDEVINIRESLEAWNTRAAPKVKALEWDDHKNSHYGIGILGEHYSIYVYSNGSELCRDRDDQSHEYLAQYPTPDEAKAAAQSHYEKLILEALV
jgi:hypothetical protein